MLRRRRTTQSRSASLEGPHGAIMNMELLDELSDEDEPDRFTWHNTSYVDSNTPHSPRRQVLGFTIAACRTGVRTLAPRGSVRITSRTPSIQQSSSVHLTKVTEDNEDESQAAATAHGQDSPLSAALAPPAHVMAALHGKEDDTDDVLAEGDFSVELIVFEGDRACHQFANHASFPILLQSTDSVSALMDLAVKEMRLPDAPSEYYFEVVTLQINQGRRDSLRASLNSLQAKVSTTERIPPNLLIVDLAKKLEGNRKDYARLYCRSRQVDQDRQHGQTIINLMNRTADIHGGTKAISISKGCTVAEVLKRALNKFRIQESLNDLVLQRVSIREHVLNEALEPDQDVFELALLAYEGHLNRSFVRFDVCRRSDVAGHPQKLFLSGLNAYATTEELTTLLNKTMTAVLLVWLPTIDAAAIPEDAEPLLVFINPKSGGGQGLDLYTRIGRYVNPHQLFDLSVAGPEPGLLAMRTVSKFRILACGGDGTVGWILSALDTLQSFLRCPVPAVAILPIGTGNDLSRVLEWGPGYTGGNVRPLLMQTLDAFEVSLDRWRVDVAPESSGEHRTLTMSNYIGFGLDASIALDFHRQREENPQRFTSRTKNKGLYMLSGMDAFVKQPCKNILQDAILLGDGQPLKVTDFQGLIILNISSWGSGADPWGRDESDKFFAPSFSDGYLEVVGVHGVMHMTHISTHMRNAKRLGQVCHPLLPAMLTCLSGRPGAVSGDPSPGPGLMRALVSVICGRQFQTLELKFLKPMPMHVDGEPWMQEAGTVTISRLPAQARMLVRRGKQPSRRTRADQALTALATGAVSPELAASGGTEEEGRSSGATSSASLGQTLIPVLRVEDRECDFSTCENYSAYLDDL
ncbi:uncharacterized protein MONBRDRAFT_37869 [Monosiga brevicollis MX1]|uniref:Diacylglycerol kinase n=1 Tax=Monosiga brevicollis TaxID=81824 RepID=A9V4C2_MONBE|nr:uncharacterized protein MONBRDRAFT_37869 [Monosiga brevicollis MX1]EDQ87685.1 predicted protein [Monosiga brevicollis MX1]|eukprot:XP_001747605.1 hypothetical protein [Monosiga brevicollis MX1]